MSINRRTFVGGVSAAALVSSTATTYAAGGKYDEPRPEEIDYSAALAAIARVKLPRKDPVYGAGGPLIELWRKPAPVRRRQVNGGRRAKARTARRSRARRA